MLDALIGDFSPLQDPEEEKDASPKKRMHPKAGELQESEGTWNPDQEVAVWKDLTSTMVVVSPCRETLLYKFKLI